MVPCIQTQRARWRSSKRWKCCSVDRKVRSRSWPPRRSRLLWHATCEEIGPRSKVKGAHSWKKVAPTTTIWRERQTTTKNSNSTTTTENSNNNKKQSPPQPQPQQQTAASAAASCEPWACRRVNWFVPKRASWTLLWTSLIWVANKDWGRI